MHRSLLPQESLASIAPSLSLYPKEEEVAGNRAVKSHCASSSLPRICVSPLHVPSVTSGSLAYAIVLLRFICFSPFQDSASLFIVAYAIVLLPFIWFSHTFHVTFPLVVVLVEPRFETHDWNRSFVAIC